MIVAVTGHRPQKPSLQKPGAEQNTRMIINWALTQLKPQWFITGMAIGVDQWAADEALKLQIPVLAAIPCQNQDQFWGTETRKKYHELLSRVQRIEMVTNGPYQKHVMQERNRWMVDRATTVIAIFDGTAGGTANCVRYAIETRARRPIQILRYDPDTLKSEWL